MLLFILSRLIPAPSVKMWPKTVGENDMTALQDISDAAIAENLEERLKAGIIYVSSFDLKSLYHYIKLLSISEQTGCC